MKSFAICLACLTALVPMQARKMDAAGAHYRKALSRVRSRNPSEEQTVEDILADVPYGDEATTDDQPSYRDFDAAAAFGEKPSASLKSRDFNASAAFNEDSSVGADISVTPFQGPSGAQDIAIQPSSGMSVQGSELSTLEGLEVPFSMRDEDRMGIDQNTAGTKVKLPPQLEGIEQTVLHLAETAKKTGKADDAMMQMIHDINKLLEDTIITDLVNQYIEAHDSVFASQKQITDCINGTGNHYNPQINIGDYNLKTLDLQHYDCRQEQLNSMDVEERLRRSCDAHKDRCTALNSSWNENGGNNIVDWKVCQVEAGKYQGSLWLGNYYQDQETYWVTLWSELNRTWSYVEGNCTLWSDCEVNRSIAENNTANTSKRCNDLQIQMDAESCKYKEAIDTEWDIYKNCCSTSSSQCPVVKAKAEKDITYLDSQYVATARIQCYMTAFGVADIETALADCRSAYYNTTFETGRRYPPRIYNSIYPFPACPVCPEAPHECGEKMNETYVAGVGVIADDARYANMSYIAGTPAYETTHYRPSPVKHLVVDCQASCCPNTCR